MHDDDCNSFAPCSREKTMYTDQIRFAAVSTLQASTVVESKRGVTRRIAVGVACCLIPRHQRIVCCDFDRFF